MIFLVVLVHAGTVYESSGTTATWWIVDDPATNDATGLVNLVVDIFGMSTLFFVSGFLAPGSVARHQGWTFLKQRFKRLVVPWLVAIFTLMPLFKVIFLYSRGLPQESWTTYFHFSNGIFSQSWLWFLPILFLFDVVYWLLSRTGIRLPNISLAAGVVGFFLVSVTYSFSVSILGASGWTKTILLDFQNEKLLSYFMVFLLGALCYRLQIFDRKPAGKSLYYAVNATAWIPITVYIIVLLTLLFRPGKYFVSLRVDVLVLWCSYYLSLLAMLYVMVATFRYYGNRRGRLGRELSANSYGVYIIHVVVLGGIALLLLKAEVPSLGKYLILTVATYVVANLLVSGYRAVKLALASAG